ncbi:hypothetical protein ACSQ6I_19810 [Anabaena sp. WFMT]|uniref:hypothetical protein n=1 Tax=Anabaena sp. WFMT TaxID=3449730 RepID=UPI003F1F1E36
MSINRYQPHLIVLPEDRANEEITNGFIQAPNINYDVISVERPAGGWQAVVNQFTKELVLYMKKFPQSMIVLLIDFDQDKNPLNYQERLDYVNSHIPKDLIDRVFVLGVVSEPEILRRDIKKSFEAIGEALATDCSENKNELWGHNLLIHNKPELERMIQFVKPFLFN